MTERFTAKRRNEIVFNRDGGKGQLQSYSEEKGFTTEVGHCRTGGVGCEALHLHHVTPNRVAISGGNESTNLITIFECQHNGRCKAQKIKPGYDLIEHKGIRLKPGKWVDPAKSFVLHKDMQEALMSYNPSGNSIQDCFKERDRKIEDGEPYWNNGHDIELLKTADDRSHNPSWWLGDKT